MKTPEELLAMQLATEGFGWIHHKSLVEIITRARTSLPTKSCDEVELWKQATEAAMQVGHHLINCKVCQMSLTIGDNLCGVHRRLVVDMVEKRDKASSPQSP